MMQEATKLADAATQPNEGVLDEVYALLDELEAAKVANGIAALDPMLQ